MLLVAQLKKKVKLHNDCFENNKEETSYAHMKTEMIAPHEADSLQMTALRSDFKSVKLRKE